MKSLRIIYHCDDNELNLNIVLVLHYRKLFVMRILLTPLFILFFIANHAQSEELKLVYSSSTEEANNEIRKMLSTHPELTKKFKLIDSKDFIFLSDEQYNQVEVYVKEFDNKDSDKHAEYVHFKSTWFSRYKSTSQLINELKK